MTAENTPAASLPTSRQRCDMRRAAMVLAAAVIPVAGAAPAQAALVNVPATHPALGQTAAAGIAATPAVAPARHLPTIPIQTAPSTVTRYVDVYMANVRSGPSMSNSVVGSVSRGTKVTGTIVNGWLKTSNGRYIGLSVLRSGSGSSSSSSGSSSSSTVTRYVTAGVGNVRSGAGLGYGVVGTLSRDTKVTGTLTSNGWLKMSNGRYISGVILTSSSPSSSSSSGSSSSSSTVTRYVTAGAGNVRSGAGLGYRVVGTLSRDTKVTGTMTSNGWLKMSNGRYISGVILTSSSPSNSSSSGSSSSSSTVTRYVTAGAGNVRSGAGLGYRVVGTLSRDTKVTGTMTSNGWLKMSNGRYISSVILTSSRPQSSASRDDVSSGGSSSVSSNAVLREAEKYFGIMYLWGGETPAGFDCSGYTQYVHAQLDISLPRTAAQQQAFATPVSNPQPGDLVFWGSPAWHVAIYAGDGMIYDSGRAGIPVQKRNMFSGVTGYGSVN